MSSSSKKQLDWKWLIEKVIIPLAVVIIGGVFTIWATRTALNGGENTPTAIPTTVVVTTPIIFDSPVPTIATEPIEADSPAPGNTTEPTEIDSPPPNPSDMPTMEITLQPPNSIHITLNDGKTVWIDQEIVTQDEFESFVESECEKAGYVCNGADISSFDYSGKAKAYCQSRDTSGQSDLPTFEELQKALASGEITPSMRYEWVYVTGERTQIAFTEYDSATRTLTSPVPVSTSRNLTYESFTRFRCALRVVES